MEHCYLLVLPHRPAPATRASCRSLDVCLEQCEQVSLDRSPRQSDVIRLLFTSQEAYKTSFALLPETPQPGLTCERAHDAAA